MTNLVVRGLDEEGAFVTAGLGPSAGTTFFVSNLAGIITMVGSLATVFIPGEAGVNRQGGIAIDIDIGID